MQPWATIHDENVLIALAPPRANLPKYCEILVTLPINEWPQTHSGYFYPVESFKPLFLLGRGGAGL